MRSLVVFAVAVVLLVVTFLGLRLWQFSRMWPKPSTEITQLTAEKRVLLQRLRAEHKFQPHNFQPLGYTGAETPEAEATGARAVDGVINVILANSDGNLPAKTVSDLIGKGMRDVKDLATEDRDRTQGYMVEIWYLLGFKGATGRFAYGSAYHIPRGFGEPLPPGWASPTQPRPVG